MKPFQKSVTVFGWFAFGSGVLLGSLFSCAGSDPEPEVIERVVTITEEVEVETKVPVPTMIESCSLATEKMFDLFELTEDMTAAAGEQATIIEEAGRAVASDDVHELNDMAQRQIDLNRESSAWIIPYMDSMETLRTFYESCQDDVG